MDVKRFWNTGIVIESIERIENRYRMIQHKQSRYFSLIGKIANVGTCSYFILLIWGIDPTAWLASAGVIGIAVGFARQRHFYPICFSGFLFWLIRHKVEIILLSVPENAGMVN